MSNLTEKDLWSEGGISITATVPCVKMPNGNIFHKCMACGRMMDKFLVVVEGKAVCRDCLASIKVNDVGGLVNELLQKLLRQAISGAFDKVK